MKRLIWILCKHGYWQLAYALNYDLTHWYAAVGQFNSFEEDKP